MSKKYVDKNGLQYALKSLGNVLKLELGKKVDKVQGKGLSTNDLTDELKQKILDAGSSSFNGTYNALIGKPTIEGKTLEGAMTLNGLGIASKSHTHTKTDIVDFPTNVSEFANDKKYQTEEEIKSAIGEAIGKISHFHFEKVVSLPEASGAKQNVIYLVPNGEHYKEYLFLGDKFEEIGDTQIDLSEYLKTSELIEVTNEEIDTIISEVKSTLTL